jgi:predicted PolB exonuclease-like 3'-5' exonuclease
LCLKELNEHVKGDVEIQEALEIQDMLSLKHQVYQLNQFDFLDRKISTMNEVAKRYTKDTRCLQHLATLYQDGTKESTDAWNKLFKADPANAKAMKKTADLLMIQGMAEKSVRLFSRALEVSNLPHSSSAWNS